MHAGPPQSLPVGLESFSLVRLDRWGRGGGGESRPPGFPASSPGRSAASVGAATPGSPPSAVWPSSSTLPHHAAAAASLSPGLSFPPASLSALITPSGGAAIGPATHRLSPPLTRRLFGGEGKAPRPPPSGRSAPSVSAAAGAGRSIPPQF